MRTFLSIAVLSCMFTSCQKSKEQPVIENDKAGIQFDWLLGKWQRLNDKEGQQTFETWEKRNDSLYSGHGFVMVETDTVWEEVMELYKKDTLWLLEVKTPGNIDNVAFAMTQGDSLSFTVENPLHDFPKMIAYQYENEKLKAVVGDDSLSIDFDFVKTVDNHN